MSRNNKSPNERNIGRNKQNPKPKASAKEQGSAVTRSNTVKDPKE